MKNENDALINFGIPVRFNDKTTKTANALRRCIKELQKWMETELNRSDHFRKWADDLQRIFPNLCIGATSQSVQLYEKEHSPYKR